MRFVRNIFKSAVRLTPLVLVLLLAFVWIRSQYWLDRNTLFLHQGTGSGAYIGEVVVYSSRGYLELSMSYGKTVASVERDVARNGYFFHSGYVGGSLKIMQFRYASERAHFLSSYPATSGKWMVINLPIWAPMEVLIGVVLGQCCYGFIKRRKRVVAKGRFPIYFAWLSAILPARSAPAV